MVHPDQVYAYSNKLSCKSSSNIQIFPTRNVISSALKNSVFMSRHGPSSLPTNDMWKDRMCYYLIPMVHVDYWKNSWILNFYCTIKEIYSQDATIFPSTAALLINISCGINTDYLIVVKSKSSNKDLSRTLTRRIWIAKNPSSKNCTYGKIKTLVAREKQENSHTHTHTHKIASAFYHMRSQDCWIDKESTRKSKTQNIFSY